MVSFAQFLASPIRLSLRGRFRKNQWPLRILPIRRGFFSSPGGGWKSCKVVRVVLHFILYRVVHGHRIPECFLESNDGQNRFRFPNKYNPKFEVKRHVSFSPTRCWAWIRINES